MRKILLLPLLMLVLGCARNHFNVPAPVFSEKVKVLGVAPFMVDSDSDIRYPQKDLLMSLITDSNRSYEQQLVRRIKGTGNFYTVALLDGDPRDVMATMLSRREKRDDATIIYNKYFWKNEELRGYLKKNSLDAVMLVVVSGITKSDRIFSSNLLDSLTADYNHLIMSAQIIDADGTILWEYPNFRGRLLTYYPMINLQYPDFSEAEANLSEKAQVKFKAFDGIKRAMQQKRKDILLRETQEPEIYGRQFDEIISLLTFEREKEKTEPAPPQEKPRSGPGAPATPAKAPEAAVTGAAETPSAAPAAAPEAPAPAPAAAPQVTAPPQPKP